jgi:hypothetical protein
MQITNLNESTGTWVRLVYHQAVIDVFRCSGPHGPGRVFNTSGGGEFVFDHHDQSAANGAEAVYVWAPTS